MRSQWVDRSKGLAIIAVILLHIAFAFHNSKLFLVESLLCDA